MSNPHILHELLELVPLFGVQSDAGEVERIELGIGILPKELNKHHHSLNSNLCIRQVQSREVGKRIRSPIHLQEPFNKLIIHLPVAIQPQRDQLITHASRQPPQQRLQVLRRQPTVPQRQRRQVAARLPRQKPLQRGPAPGSEQLSTAR